MHEIVYTIGWILYGIIGSLIVLVAIFVYGKRFLKLLNLIALIFSALLFVGMAIGGYLGYTNPERIGETATGGWAIFIGAVYGQLTVLGIVGQIMLALAIVAFGFDIVRYVIRRRHTTRNTPDYLG